MPVNLRMTRESPISTKNDDDAAAGAKQSSVQPADDDNSKLKHGRRENGTSSTTGVDVQQPANKSDGSDSDSEGTDNRRQGVFIEVNDEDSDVEPNAAEQTPLRSRDDASVGQASESQRSQSERQPVRVDASATDDDEYDNDESVDDSERSAAKSDRSGSSSDSGDKVKVFT